MRSKPLELVLTLTFVATLGACSTTPSEDALLREIRESTIVPQLGSYDEQEQRRATQKVREALDRAPEGTAEILAATLADSVTEDRTKVVCAYLLSTLKDRRGIPTLLEHLGTTNEAASDLIRTALRNYGSSIVPHIVETLETGDTVARTTSANLLLDLRSREGYDAMWRRMKIEPSPEVRFLLVCGTSYDSRPVAIERLLHALEDRDELVREFAWDALRTRLELPKTLKYDPAAEPLERNRQIAALDQWIHQRQ